MLHSMSCAGAGKGDGGKRASTASGKRKSMAGKSRGSEKSTAATSTDVEKDIVVNPQVMLNWNSDVLSKRQHSNVIYIMRFWF